MKVNDFATNLVTWTTIIQWIVPWLFNFAVVVPPAPVDPVMAAEKREVLAKR